MTTRLLIAALAATASLAACGGDDGTSPQPASASERQAANRKAMLDFARCMREHGVDMPDPKFDGGRVQMAGPRNADPDKMRAAEKACAKFRESVKPPELSEQDKEKFRKAALENARCMREHGIDFPDPTFDENGGAQIKIDRASGLDPNDPKFRKAMEACRDTLPDFGRTRVGG